ncbi:MAG: 4-hydroxythreonine-4-phosphate dehydrogenase PdxA [Pseudomonadota bacterium]
MTPIAVTPGEPAGIGPDLAVMLAQREQVMPMVFVCDPDLLESRAKMLGLPLSVHLAESPPFERLSSGSVWLSPVECKTSTPGQGDPNNADYVLDTLRIAVEGCQSGRFAGLVTGPVNKALINQGGIEFSGHTEFLAEMTGGYPVMMLVADKLRVALATTHLPLRAVPDALDQALIERVLRIVHSDLQSRFSVLNPRILICGLNPHAGEGGYLGDEEITVINPVIEKLRQEGLQLEGSLPADTLFTPQHLASADGVLAMYHDQGLPVLKHAGFGEAVNITLGLPIIRTSVDHGTAFDLAGTGRASCGSLQAAVDMAAAMVSAAP